MKYYPTEREKKGHLKSGFKVKEYTGDSPENDMAYCYEFNQHDICEIFCRLLFLGFNNIYAKHNPFIPIAGANIFWISNSSQSHLRNLIMPKPDKCKIPSAYQYNYTFSNGTDCINALNEMQRFANVLYQTLKQID